MELAVFLSHRVSCCLGSVQETQMSPRYPQSRKRPDTPAASERRTLSAVREGPRHAQASELSNPWPVETHHSPSFAATMYWFSPTK